MSNIKTKEITTKSGIVVTVKEAITYGEHRAMVANYLDDKLTKAEQITLADKLSVENIVVSINGSSENVYDTFSNMALADAQVILAHIKEVLDPKVDGK